MKGIIDSKKAVEFMTEGFEKVEQSRRVGR